MVRPAHSSPSDALPRGKPDLCEPLERPSWCSKPAVLFNAARFYQISIAVQLSELKRLHTYKLNHANPHTAGHSANRKNRRPKAGISPGRFPPANPCWRADKFSSDGAKQECSAFCSPQIIIGTISSKICALRESVSSGQRKFSGCKSALPWTCAEIHQLLVHFHKASVCYFHWGLVKTCVKCSSAEAVSFVLLCFRRPCNLFKDEHLDSSAMLIWLLLKNAPHAYEITLLKGRRWDLQLALFSRGHFKSTSPHWLRTSLTVLLPHNPIDFPSAAVFISSFSFPV